MTTVDTCATDAKDLRKNSWWAHAAQPQQRVPPGQRALWFDWPYVVAWFPPPATPVEEHVGQSVQELVVENPVSPEPQSGPGNALW